MNPQAKESSLSAGKRTNKQRWAKFQTLWPKQSQAERTAYLDAGTREQRLAIIDRWIDAGAPQ